MIKVRTLGQKRAQLGRQEVFKLEIMSRWLLNMVHTNIINLSSAFYYTCVCFGILVSFYLPSKGKANISYIILGSYFLSY